jgi:hypothetical protein
MTKSRVETVYETSSVRNPEAFADGEYKIAYDLLLLASRCEQRRKNSKHLKKVERLAEDQHTSTNYSRKAAIARGNLGCAASSKLQRNITEAKSYEPIFHVHDDQTYGPGQAESKGDPNQCRDRLRELRQLGFKCCRRQRAKNEN